MSSQPPLGMILIGQHERDAVHVAIAPVLADTDLQPGAHVGLTRIGTAKCMKDTIGVVDPFLTRMVKWGEQFFLFLYPSTITSLRHDWTHPAFGAAGPSKSDEELEKAK